jgi:hypothetical protein
VDTISCASEGEKRNAPLLLSEFCEGPASARNIDSNFFTEVTDCLWANSLETTLGLEAIQGQAEKMIEFSFDISSLLLKEEKVKAEVRKEKKGQFKLQKTRWTITVKNGTVYKTEETRCAILPALTGHIKWTDSKAKGVLDVVKILREEGILNM